MEAAEITPKQSLDVLASEREVTRLARRLSHGRISREAGGSHVHRSGEDGGAVSVLGRGRPYAARPRATSSVRDARNQAEFLARASEAAGTPVEVISARGGAAGATRPSRRAGAQTAGKVAHLVDNRLVGSAEIIASENGRMLDAVSKPLGAVRSCRELPAG